MVDELTRYEICKEIIRMADENGLTIGTAESCTGGLVCGALTDVPGSSGAVRGSIVSYAIPIKEEVLGVPKQITEDPKTGVISPECAHAMCEGARNVLGCDIVVSITGIAGPGGEEPGKPVGTVWFGVASPSGTKTYHKHFHGNRDDVRTQAVNFALRRLYRSLKKEIQQG